MHYVSTRGGGRPQRFSDILLEGLAPDGGLYVPERLPQADLGRWRRLSYAELAVAVLREFMDDVPRLDELVARTYTGRIFGGDDITPLKTLEPGLHLLALAVALVMLPVAAQERKVPAKKMPVAKGHSKPSPEQVRRFNELAKKRQDTK